MLEAAQQRFAAVCALLHGRVAGEAGPSLRSATAAAGKGLLQACQAFLDSLNTSVRPRLMACSQKAALPITALLDYLLCIHMRQWGSRQACQAFSGQLDYSSTIAHSTSSQISGACSQHCQNASRCADLPRPFGLKLSGEAAHLAAYTDRSQVAVELRERTVQGD